MHNPVFVLENEIHKLQQDFDIQTDNQISAGRPDIIIMNKRKKKELTKLWTLLPWLTIEQN